MTELSEYTRRLAQLKNDQTSWRSHWQEISDYVLPRRTRFWNSEVNRGTKQNLKIYNNTATRAVRTLASGIMASVTSPARPWFKLSIDDPELAEDREVKDWLGDAEWPVRSILAKSNFYNALSDGVYEDLVAYGTGAVLLEEDDDDVLRCFPLILGSYWLASSYEGRVDTIYRELTPTVAQAARQFGLGKLSKRTQQAHRDGQLDQRVTIIHLIEPNEDRQPGKADARGMKWLSLWFEFGHEDPNAELRRGGYHEFPVMAPRWSLRPGDVYGRSPVMDCLGDVKSLQHLELRKAEVYDKIVRPPMVAPQMLQQNRPSLIPGDVTYIPNGSTARFEPALIVPPAAVEVGDAAILRTERRIESTLFADLWRAMLDDERLQRATAEEIRAKKEERMLQLGPVLEQLNQELFDPAVERVFRIALRRGLVQPPPRRILQKKGAEVEIEYTSILHQALKAVGLASIERTVGFVGNLAALPGGQKALAKLNLERMVEAHGDAAGLPPHLIRSDAEMAQLQQEEAKQALAMQQASEAAKSSGAAAGEASVAPAGPASPAAAAVAAGADQGGDANVNRILASLGPAASGGGFPSVAA